MGLFFYGDFLEVEMEVEVEVVYCRVGELGVFRLSNLFPWFY